MKNIFTLMSDTLKHLNILHEVFVLKENYNSDERPDYNIYKENEDFFREALNTLDFDAQLYNAKGRQMILADFFEYIFLGRGYYSIKTTSDREKFIKAILHFVNLLMCYEVMTVSKNLRKKVLEKLGNDIPEIANENEYNELKEFDGSVGLKKKESDAPNHLNQYFDSILPKTAGGLWHELIVYIILLRNNLGYIVPLLLSQRLISKEKHIIPPDFLIITHDKHIYGIEVGTGKELQSSSFLIQSNIPVLAIDTLNSRVSDRCPICKKWIPFCPFVINNYSNFNEEINKIEIKCLDNCDIYSNKDDIVEGKCLYTKYSRNKTNQQHTHHDCANGYHYHYKCVLEEVTPDIKEKIISARDTTALKTHYPYYSGLEGLIKNT